MNRIMSKAFNLQRNRTAFTLVELLVSITVISILISLLLPAVQAAREASRRSDCLNRARQLALGLQMHASDFDLFPSNGGVNPESVIRSVAGNLERISTKDLRYGDFFEWGIADAGSDPRKQAGSWAFSILPKIEQHAAYQQMDFQSVQPTFLCPSRNRPEPLPPVDDAHGEYRSAGYAWSQSDFCGNAKVIRNFPLPMPLSMVSDGLSQTFVLGEKAYDRSVHGPTSWYWDEPIFSGGSKGTARAGLIIIPDGHHIAFKDNWGSAHPSGAVFARADGSTKFVTPSIDYQTMRAALTPRGGEVIKNDAG